jgi:hypothetical protein
MKMAVQKVNIKLMIKAASTSEMSLTFCHTRWRNNPEGSHLHVYHCDNLKSQTSLLTVIHFFLPPVNGGVFVNDNMNLFCC